jgi:hypothetical protein
MVHVMDEKNHLHQCCRNKVTNDNISFLKILLSHRLSYSSQTTRFVAILAISLDSEYDVLEREPSNAPQPEEHSFLVLEVP